jgi:hypothetical protein
MSEKKTTAEWWSGLQERERNGLIALGVWFGLLIPAVAVYFFQQSLADTEDEIARYKDALTTMAQYGPEYMQNKREAELAKKGKGGADGEKFSREVMLKNDLALTSFVADHASAVDVKIDNYDENVIPKSGGKDGGPIITEKELRIEIRQAKVSKIMELLDRIDKSKEPVVIKRINLRDVRKNPGNARVTISVSTYTLTEQEG